MQILIFENGCCPLVFSITGFIIPWTRSTCFPFLDDNRRNTMAALVSYSMDLDLLWERICCLCPIHRVDMVVHICTHCQHCCNSQTYAAIGNVLVRSCYWATISSNTHCWSRSPKCIPYQQSSMCGCHSQSVWISNSESLYLLCPYILHAYWSIENLFNYPYLLPNKSQSLE